MSRYKGKNSWERVSSSKKQKIRRELVKRDGNGCQGCGIVLGLRGIDGLTVDHIVPRSRGGRNLIENFQLLCFDCNLAKGDGILVPKKRLKLNFDKREGQT